MSDLESPWKEMLQQDTRLALAFFYEDIHDDLDWSRDIESLEQERRKAVPQSEVTRFEMKQG